MLEFITSANVCCGAHAGSLETTRRTVKACLAKGIKVGAHPGYPDPEHFGRRTLHLLGMDSQEVMQSIFNQVETIPEAKYIKPHGALYNDSATEFGGLRDTPQSAALLEREDQINGYDGASIPASFILKSVFEKFKLPMMGLPGTYHTEISLSSDHPMIREGFIDRRYTDDGKLVPRSHPDAIIHDLAEAAEQAVRLAEKCDSLCVHGDNPEAPALLNRVRKALEQQGFAIKAP